MKNKVDIIKDFRINDKDTGSVEVQVALLTERINHLNEHFATHKKDNAAKMGQQKLVGHRRSCLSYIKNKSVEKYEELIARLGLRK